MIMIMIFSTLHTKLDGDFITSNVDWTFDSLNERFYDSDKIFPKIHMHGNMRGNLLKVGLACTVWQKTIENDNFYSQVIYPAIGR